MAQGLCSNGPKAELVQRVHNYINIIREAKGLPVDAAEVAHMEQVMQDDADCDALDIVCASCLSGETTEDNDILICDGDHSKPVGCVVNPPSLTFLTTHGSVRSAQYRGQMLPTCQFRRNLNASCRRLNSMSHCGRTPTRVRTRWDKTYSLASAPCPRTMTP